MDAVVVNRIAGSTLSFIGFLPKLLNRIITLQLATVWPRLSFCTIYYSSANVVQLVASSAMLLSSILKVKQKSPLLRAGFSNLVGVWLWIKPDRNDLHPSLLPKRQ